jgi:hypothetical protein
MLLHLLWPPLPLLVLSHRATLAPATRGVRPAAYQDALHCCCLHTAAAIHHQMMLVAPLTGPKPAVVIIAKYSIL